MKVVIAMDLSLYGEQVLNSVIQRRWPENSSFKLLTVLSPVEWDEESSAGWKRFAKDVMSRQTEEAERVLGAARATILEARPDAIVHVDVRTGNPRTQIITAAADWMADKIIIGAHGRAANRILGAVPHAVAQHAHCTVELVRLHSVPTSNFGQEKVAESLTV